MIISGFPSTFSGKGRDKNSRKSKKKTNKKTRRSNRSSGGSCCCPRGPGPGDL